MAKEVWPSKEVVEASKKVVCLAVYRWDQSQGENSVIDSEWAIRFNVMGYPQFRYVDGWMRPLEGPLGTSRTKLGIKSDMLAAVSAVKKKRKKSQIKLPDVLKEKIPFTNF